MKLFFAVISLTFSSTVFAGFAWENVTIKEILVHDNGSTNYPGLVIVTMDSPISTAEKPTCVQTSEQSSFAIDLSRLPSNAQYSLILAAKMANKSLTVQINQTCNSGRALLRNIYVNE